ncbi:MAG TPA: DUF4432 family protein, partial [Cellulomonas sp.]
MRAFRLGARAVLDDGLVALPEALASVEEVVRTGGERLLVLRVADGLSVDVRPDRGLDLGAAWWRGIPVAWRSPHRVDPGPGHGWEERFLGGLVVTCGPENIGPPTAAGGQHGSHHLTPATEVRWWRETTPDGIEVHVRGVIGHSTLYGTRVVVEREIVVGTGRARVEIRDEVRNDGDEPVGAPLLYHVNLGAPLLVPGSRLELRGGGAGGGAGSSAAEVDGDVDGEVDVVGPVRSRVREPLPEGREPLSCPRRAPGSRPWRWWRSTGASRSSTDGRGPSWSGPRTRAARRGRATALSAPGSWWSGRARRCRGCAPGRGRRAGRGCSGSSRPTPRCSGPSGTPRTPAPRSSPPVDAVAPP